jgi:hypothetical protein
MQSFPPQQGLPSQQQQLELLPPIRSPQNITLFPQGNALEGMAPLPAVGNDTNDPGFLPFGSTFPSTNENAASNGTNENNTDDLEQTCLKPLFATGCTLDDDCGNFNGFSLECRGVDGDALNPDDGLPVLQCQCPGGVECAVPDNTKVVGQFQSCSDLPCVQGHGRYEVELMAGSKEPMCQQKLQCVESIPSNKSESVEQVCHTCDSCLAELNTRFDCRKVCEGIVAIPEATLAPSTTAPRRGSKPSKPSEPSKPSKPSDSKAENASQSATSPLLPSSLLCMLFMVTAAWMLG